MPDLSNLWQYIYAGDLVGFVEAIFTGVMGNLFYGFIVLFISLAVYMKTQSTAYVAIIWIMLGTFFVTMIPVAGYKVAGPLLLLSVTSIIFYLVTRWR